MCWGLVIAFPLLVLTGQHWQRVPGGPGTRGVMTVAAFICPAAAREAWAVRVADGAHALDRAMSGWIAMQFHMGPSCSIPTRPLTGRGDRRRDRNEGEKMRGMSKSM